MDKLQNKGTEKKFLSFVRCGNVTVTALVKQAVCKQDVLMWRCVTHNRWNVRKTPPKNFYGETKLLCVSTHFTCQSTGTPEGKKTTFYDCPILQVGQNNLSKLRLHHIYKWS